MSHCLPAGLRVVLSLSLAVALLAVPAGLTPLHAAAGEGWTFVDGNLSTGLNRDAVRNAVDPALTVFADELYVAWSELNASGVSQIRVRKYDGATWTWVDGGGASGVNLDTARGAVLPSLAVFGGTLYAIWSEANAGGAYLTRVKRYDGGSAWTAIDGSATNGLNKDAVSSGSTSAPALWVHAGVLYASWVESYAGAGGAYQLHVKRYDGGTSWSFVDGGGFTGLNVDTNRPANRPSFATWNNALYLFWTEANASSKRQIRAKRYDGGATWTAVDGGSGLNYNSGNSVDLARAVPYNNGLYAFWVENYRVRIKSYNGSGWSTADGNAGFKQNALNYVFENVPPAAFAYGGRLYFTWGEDVSVDPWAIQTRAAFYSGGTMTFMDGNDSTAGLNYNRLQYAYRQALAQFNGALYVAWHEYDGMASQLRVRRTSLPPAPLSVAVPANGWYTPGQNLDFTVAFSKAVNVTGTPVLPVTLNSGVVNAPYLSGSSTTALVFRYTVAAGNLDTDGIALGASLALNGGTIRDAVDAAAANLLLSGVASTTGVLVDAAPPTPSSTSPVDNATGVGLNQNLVVSFSESVVKGSGNVVIRRSADDGLVETIAAASSAVSVAGSTVTIDPSATFAGSTGYYVLIDTGAFRDVAGNDAVGISAKTTWNFVTADATPPAGYTVSIDQPYVNNASKTAMSFTFAGAELGTTYNYTLTSSGGGVPVTGSGPIASATQQVSGVTTLGLNEGTLTLSVTLTDASGNTGAAATDTVLKDTLLPSSYAASIEQAYLNPSNQAALSFVLSGAETGASYEYSVASSGGGATLTGSGTVSSGSTKTISGLNATGLGDGVLTLSLTMTDVAGNPGSPVTDTVVKDTVAPGGYSVSIAQPSIETGNETAMSFSFAGAEVGASFSYSVSSSGGAGVVTGGGSITTPAQAVSGIDVSGLDRGTLTLSVTLTDAAGNTGAAATDTVVKNSAPATDYYTLAPCRVLDTREPEGPYGGPALAAGAVRVFALAGQCDIPATARAVSVNVTATAATAAGHLRLYPAGAALPNVSAVNYVPGLTRANNAVVPLSAQGELAVYCNQASGTAHVLLDVTGYFE
jgi:hypothetical protein